MIGSLTAATLVLGGACRPDFDGLTRGDEQGGGSGRTSSGGEDSGGVAGCADDCAAGAGRGGAGGPGRGGGGGSGPSGGSSPDAGSSALGGGGIGEGGTQNAGGTDPGGDGGTEAGGAGGDGGTGIEECFPVVPKGAGPIVHYDFEDSAEDTVADVSGNGNDGTIAGARRLASGRHGRALEFTAKGQYVAFPGGIVSDLDAMTVAMWVRLDAAPEGSTLFDFGPDESHRITLTANTGTGTRYRASAGGAEEVIVLPRPLPGDAWVHVALVLASGKALFYVNGLEIGRINATIAPSDLSAIPEAWIGKSHDPDVDLEWAIDEFRLYDRGLAREEVAELALPDHLYFDFDEPCGERVHDRSEAALVGELPRGGTWAPGRIGGSLELDGVEQYVALPQGIVRDCDDFTLAFWAQRTSASGISEHIIDFGQNQRTFLYVSPQARGGNVRFAIKLNADENDVGAEYALVGQQALPVGLWQHVAVVIRDDTGFGTLYVNGQQFNSQPLPLRPSDLGATIANTIGRSQYHNAALGPDSFYAGRIDDLRISCRPFSAAEVAFLAINP
jgi:hypothetical protein